ncbi:MAG: DKNYY domain-containing protein [Saprospiraceae bacterium]|uniref:DKNYY domain-containing protein n=1 Tax=Candidatus Opimibacter skivensis TaxID=2982028 RepID=A0A9D7T0A4_9BACT|nr:DKNYY domain-containing protein [Candidatus Opimibacter skivensis]
MLRKLMILGLLYTLFGCGGDGKPGLFSSNGYHVGKEKVWYRSSTGMDYSVKEVFGADARTFAERELSSKMYKGATAYYGFDDKSVFWADAKIEGVDLPSFEYLCNQYSRDKNAVYYMAQELTRDVAHLEIVGRDFIKDSTHVYYGSDVFSDDPGHFAEVGQQGSNYYKDSRNGWYNTYPLKDADPATLHIIGPNTAADAKHVYVEMNEVEGADQLTYQVLTQGYSKDAHHVYLNSEMIEGADPATFQILQAPYSKDDKHCFNNAVVIAGADPASFQLIDEFYGKDNRQVFINGTPIEGADPATFRILNSNAGCSCDAKHAYTLQHRIEGVDPAKFPKNGQCKSCNESGVTF